MQLRTGLPIVGLCCACDAEGGWSDSGYSGAESLNVYNEDGEIVDVEDDCKGAETKPLYISPDDSNSTASPVLVREFGETAPVRVWEFLNYYTFDYAPAP